MKVDLYDVVVISPDYWSEINQCMKKSVRYIDRGLGLLEAKSSSSFYNMGSDRYVSEVVKNPNSI